MHLVALIAVRAVDTALNSGLAGAIPVAFLVGVVSFFTPCILPLVPGYLSFVSGLSGEALDEGRGGHRVLAGTLLFMLGFAVVFTGFGAAATTVGRFLNDEHSVFDKVAGGIVILMGLIFLMPALVRLATGARDVRYLRFLRFLEMERRPFLANVKPGLAGAFPLGVAFAIGWTPCVGPGLGVILSFAFVESSATRGAILLLSFSLGFGVWFVLGGLAFRRATAAIAWLRRHQMTLQVVGGVFLLAIGVLLVTNKWLDVIAPLRRLVTNYAPPV
ncbi:MAG: cytochrome c biogenesis CcdA family protein [Actinomycetota bacterium]|nr:cytochrome c biogenesis protein CcdA [Actinomycetota bacterium]